MNNSYFAVYDFESDSADPTTTEPVEISIKIVHPRSLKVVDSFNSMMCPPDFKGMDDNEYIDGHKSTIEWHAKTLNKSVKEVLQSWLDAPPQDIVWSNIVRFVEKYHKNGKVSKYNCPIPVGYNIINFDEIICQRLKEKYSTKYLFSSVFKVDLMHTVFNWFENSQDIEKYNFDTMRDYLGIDTDGAHTAINDVAVFAELFIKFTKLTRRTAEQVAFAGSFAGLKFEV